MRSVLAILLIGTENGYSLKKINRGVRMRRYKTVIEIVCEAKDGGEAIDVAGEYLRGSLSGGVAMRCKTAPVATASKIAMKGLCVLLLAGLGSAFIAFGKPHQPLSGNLAALDACQAPLKTKIEGKARMEFKEGWRDQEFNKALEYIVRQ